MNLSEAIKQERPFYHKDMFGAFLRIGQHLVHHDNIENYHDMDFIMNSVSDNHTEWCLRSFSINDHLRDDWIII